MNSTSASLLERLTARPDPAAWSRFVELYTPLMVRWCQRLGLSDSDAADFIQDVYLILVDQLPRFRYNPSQSFRAWLKTVLMNIWRKHQRKVSRGPKLQGDPDHQAKTDPGQLVDEAEHREYLIRRALKIVQVDFEPTTWKACWQLLIEERPAQEVADELGLTINAVYLAKSRVLRHLRQELAGLVD